MAFRLWLQPAAWLQEQRFCPGRAMDYLIFKGPFQPNPVCVTGLAGEQARKWYCMNWHQLSESNLNSSWICVKLTIIISEM